MYSNKTTDEICRALESVTVTSDGDKDVVQAALERLKSLQSQALNASAALKPSEYTFASFERLVSQIRERHESQKKLGEPFTFKLGPTDILLG